MKSSTLALRWKLLLAIAPAVILLDQWTKLLAVTHLTPAIVQLHAEGPPPAGEEERAELIASIGPIQHLQYFLDERAASPCADRVDRCPPLHVIGGFWDLRYAENRGAAWSLFADLDDRLRLPLLVGVAGLAVLFVLYFLRELEPAQRVTMVALSAITGGALGNLIDRVRLGYVIDFLSWYRGSYHFPTFNVADSAITTGAALIILSLLQDVLRKNRADAAAGPAPSGSQL